MRYFMRILVIANAMNTLSGGDKRFVEIFRRLAKKGNFVKIMLPKVGHVLCNTEQLPFLISGQMPQSPLADGRVHSHPIDQPH